MTAEGVTSRRVFHIYLPDADRLACDTPPVEVEVVVAEPVWRVIDTARLCTECMNKVQLRGTRVAAVRLSRSP